MRVPAKAGGLRRHALAAALAALLALALCGPAAAHAEAPPHIKHLFVILLENEDAEDTFGPVPPSPYLGTTLREAGAFVPNYYGIGHQSLDNYIALASGQPPNPQTQADCQLFSDFTPIATLEDGVAVNPFGGCVFPTSVQTVANQLENSGRTWRNYAQDMAAGAAAGEATSCRHPALGAPDNTQMASATNQYAARHVPFVYFHSIIDFETCQRNVVDLEHLTQDLQSAESTPQYSFITPDLCADGHDATCADGTSPGGFAGIDAFLREWVPRIKASPAYRDHGAILLTFDESESGAESCCNEENGPNSPNNGGATAVGAGGGRVGAVIVSPCIKPGTETQFPYNHYSALRWTEDNFGLSHLADASTEGLSSFGTDVFSNPSCDTGANPVSEPGGPGSESGVPASEEPGKPGSQGPVGPAIPGSVGPAIGGPVGESARAGALTRLHVRPRRSLAGKRQLFRFRLASEVAECQAGATVRFGGREVKTNGRGRAHVKLRLRHAGKRVAVAKAPGCKPAKAPVHVKRHGRH